MHGRVIGAESVLVPTIVDGDFDANTSIYQPDDGRRYSDKVGVAAICRTGKSRSRRQLSVFIGGWLPC